MKSKKVGKLAPLYCIIAGTYRVGHFYECVEFEFNIVIYQIVLKYIILYHCSRKTILNGDGLSINIILLYHLVYILIGTYVFLKRLAIKVICFIFSTTIG